MSIFSAIIAEENRLVVTCPLNGGMTYTLTRAHFNDIYDAQSGGGAAKLAAAGRAILDEMVAVFGEPAVDRDKIRFDIDRNVVKQMLLLE